MRDIYLLGDWTPSDDEQAIYELAKQYHLETERHDRRICTGPMGRDGILPATLAQRRKSSNYALQVRKEVLTVAKSMGIDPQRVRKAISHFDCRAIEHEL